MTYKHTSEVRLLDKILKTMFISLCSAPNFTPTNLTLLHMNATSATISWTAVNATEADGYVVYSTPQSTNTTAVDVGNVTQYTLEGLVPGNTYNITVRAYQDLLGPESGSIHPTIPPGINLITIVLNA